MILLLRQVLLCRRSLRIYLRPVQPVDQWPARPLLTTTRNIKLITRVYQVLQQTSHTRILIGRLDKSHHQQSHVPTATQGTRR